MKLLIVEDELIISEHISRILKSQGYTSIQIAPSVEAAIVIIEIERPDMVLSDIDFKGTKSGLELGELLNTVYQIPFIYITSHTSANLVRKASLTRPNAYLVKPFKKEDLLVALEIAFYNAEQRNPELNTDSLSFKDGTVTVKIPFSEIVLLKAEENYTAINTTKQRPRFVRYYISDLQKKLPDSLFIRIHRSYIINKNYISEIHSDHLVICNFQLPIGRAYKLNIDEIRKV